MSDKNQGTMSFSIVDEIIKSNELRSSGEEFGYYYNKDGRLDIGDQFAVSESLYVDLNEAIVEEGKSTTEELKGLASKATGIDKNPMGTLPLGIPYPTKQNIDSFVTSFLNKIGVPMEGSMFVGDLLTDINESGFGLAHLTGLGELAEVAEGFPKFQAGLGLDDTGVATEGLIQTVAGGVGAYPFIKDAVNKTSPKAKEALSWMADKAKKFIKKDEGKGDPIADFIIELDNNVIKQGGNDGT